MNLRSDDNAFVTMSRVYDGDTFDISDQIAPEFPDMKWSVRVYGIDTPEKGWRASCDSERELSDQATAFAKKLFAEHGARVELIDAEHDKYGGRILARVVFPDGTDYAQEMINAGFAREYFGGKKKSWCPASTVDSGPKS